LEINVIRRILANELHVRVSWEVTSSSLVRIYLRFAATS